MTDTAKGTLIAAAMRYHAAGWHPIELAAGTKYPPPEGRTGYGGVDMTAAEVAAAPWTGNIGSRMPADVLGLDVDAYRQAASGETVTTGLDTWERLKRELGPLPRTWVSHSGRNDGSGIYYYRVPVMTAWAFNLPGIEVIQRGHRYSVFPPSTHPDHKGTYGWWDQAEGGPTDEPPRVEDLPDLPWPWIAYLSRPDATSTRAHAVDDAGARAFLDAHVRGWQPGYVSVIVEHFIERTAAGHSRHDSMQHCLTWAMEHCRAGVAAARSAVERLAGVWVEALAGEPRRAAISAPGRTTEFEAMLRHAIGKAEAKTDAELLALRHDVLGPFSDETLARPPLPPLTGPATDDQEPAEGPHSFARVDLIPYLDGTATRTEGDCLRMDDGRGLLHRARLNGVHGDSGTGKSWLMALLIRELTQAGEVVMLLDLEDTPDPLVERLRQIGVADALIGSRVVFVAPDDAFRVENVALLVAMIQDLGVTHLILDSLGEAFALEGINENNDAEVAPWLRAVCRTIIKHTGAGVTMIDHGTKAAEKPLEPSGSKRKRAAITGTGWFMSTSEAFTRATGGRAELRCAKDRHGQYRRGDLVARLVMGVVDTEGKSTLGLYHVPPTIPLPEMDDPLDDVKLEVLRAGRKARRPLDRQSWLARVERRAELKRAAFDELLAAGSIVQISAGKSPTFEPSIKPTSHDA